MRDLGFHHVGGPLLGLFQLSVASPFFLALMPPIVLNCENVERMLAFASPRAFALRWSEERRAMAGSLRAPPGDSTEIAFLLKSMTADKPAKSLARRHGQPLIRRTEE